MIAMAETENSGLIGQLSTSEALSGRQEDRVRVGIDAGLRQRGAAGITVEILDLSQSGFRASTHLDLAAGSDVWLKLPGLEALHAKVAWARGNFIGCAFERPLHPAVLDMIVKRGG